MNSKDKLGISQYDIKKYSNFGRICWITIILTVFQNKSKNIIYVVLTTYFWSTNTIFQLGSLHRNRHVVIYIYIYIYYWISRFDSVRFRDIAPLKSNCSWPNASILQSSIFITGLRCRDAIHIYILKARWLHHLITRWK